MLDFNHVLSTPGLDLQSFIAVNSAVPSTGSGGQQWQTWRKPRGCKFVYMIGVGGGASGGTGTNTATTSGGGGGGGSGAQAAVMIPAFMVPDVLYIQCGHGGRQPAALVAGAAGVAGIVTYISIEPFTTNPTTNDLFLIAPGGSGGTAATTAVAGGAGLGGIAPTIATMPLAGRGFFSLFNGQNGSSGGGVPGNGANVTIPTTGVMVTGGSGGGGKSATVFGTGGTITTPTGGVSTGSTDFFPLSITAAVAAAGATPAGIGRDGIIVRNMIMNLGGAGGGSASETSGGIAGAGGNGAPGCGGGGAGGSSVTAGVTTLARPGNGGDGFVLIASW
jgi:hypothetical protein